MDNGTEQQHRSSTPKAAGTATASQEIPPVPTVSDTPQQSETHGAAPVKKAPSYIYAGLGALILLAILLPKSTFAQALSYPIIILGIVAGIKFFVDTIRASMRINNALIKIFVIIGGLGIGVVIFIVCLIAGAVVGFTKNPNPQSTG